MAFNKTFDAAGPVGPADVGIRTGCRAPSANQHSRSRWRTKLFAQSADAAAANCPVFLASGIIDDDQFHAHHHCIVAASASDWNTVCTSQPSNGWPCPIPDLVRDGPGLR